jgi:hypothetical protein
LCKSALHCRNACYSRRFRLQDVPVTQQRSCRRDGRLHNTDELGKFLPPDAHLTCGCLGYARQLCPRGPWSMRT